MTQHIHKAIIDQLTADTSLEVEGSYKSMEWETVNLLTVVNNNGFWQFRIKPKPPVDPYAHLRAANEEGRVAWHNNITGEWVMPAGKKWDCLDYVPPDRYKIVEPDRVSEVHHHRIYFGIGAPMIDITEQYTLSGLTGKITAKVVE